MTDPTPLNQYTWTLRMNGGHGIALLVPGNPSIIYDGQFGIYSLLLSVPDQQVLNQFLQIQLIEAVWSGGPSAE